MEAGHTSGFTKHTTFETSVVIDKPLEEVWKTIHEFYGMSWAGIEAKPQNESHNTHDNVLGGVRVLDVGGKHVKEQLVEYSAKNHYYTYHIVHVDEGLLPGKFINYSATIRLYKVTDGNRTFISWKGRFDGQPETAAAAADVIGNHIWLPALNKLK